MPVLFDSDQSLRLSQKVGEVDRVDVVGWVRVPRPLEGTASAAFLAIVAAVVGVWRVEELADMVRREERGAAWPAVHERRLDRGTEVLLRRHVAQGVVDEDGIELPPESKGPHVALD